MRRRRSFFATCLLGLVAVLLIAAAGAAIWLAYFLPLQVEKDFGPPAAKLSLLQLIGYDLQLMSVKDRLLKPLNSSGSTRPFTIDLGEEVPSISRRLTEEGFIPDGDAFQIYLIYTGLDTKIQAGEYSLSAAMPAVQIAARLQDATPEEVKFGVLAGWRLEEIAAALPTSGLNITPDEFLQAAGNPQIAPSLTQVLPSAGSLEGFLFPGTYRFKRDITAGEMILAMVQNFTGEITPEMKQGFAKQGLDLYQATILASIVQKEAVVEDEQPAIASVFLNRLAAGMKLDSDPTVQYALGFNTLQNSWWTNPLTTTDLQTDSPYNTYIYPELPPGPISNPGLSALKAVAFPEQTPYYYFRARCDGSGRHSFAETFEQHVNNACQ